MVSFHWATLLKNFLLAALVASIANRALAADDANITRATLANGLRVVIVRNTLAPVATTVINYLVGSDETTAAFPGTAHATEHMMFRGSKGLSANQLADITAAMGGDFDADTQQAVTQYFFTVPSEDIDLALHIESLRMQSILATSALWGKERGAIEQEVAQDLSDPDYVFYTQLLTAMFKGTPYEHDALGTRPSFDKTTGTNLRNFHNTWYVPNNAILVVVGDVDPDSVLTQVKELFGGIPAGKLPDRAPFNFEPVKSQALTLDTDQPYGMSVVAFRFPGTDSPDFAAAEILSDVLSSQRGQLYQLVPDGKALFAQFSYETLPKSAMGYAMAGFPAGANATNLLDQVKAILAHEKTNGALADLVEAAKRLEIAQAEAQKNSVSGLAMAWANALAVEGRNSLDDDVDAMKKVTVDDVNRVAQQYLNQDQAITAILTPQPSGKPTSSKGYGGQESFAPSKTQSVKLPDWAEKIVNRLKVPDSTTTPVVTMLPNGVKLIVQPESISDTVSVYGRVKHRAEVETPAGKDGVEEVMGQLFSYGTTSLDRVAFQKALDDIGATESAGTDFSITSLSGQFDRSVELLAANELTPALPEDAFKIIQPQLAASTAGRMKSPSYLADRALRRDLFPTNDPSQRETTPETLQALSINDVRNYYHDTIRPDLTTIVVIGKVTPDHAREVVEKYFGDWQASGPKPNTLLPTAPPNGPDTTVVPDSSRVQSEVTLAQTLALTRTNDDYYALQLGNHVLGGAFYATRLYRDLREENGLVYFVESSFTVGETRGVYQLQYACDPPNIGKARAVVATDLKAMQTKDITDQELQQARALLLREIPLSESSMDSIAGGWLTRSLLGLPLDEPIQAARRYLQLTAPDVRAAYAKWLRVNDLVQVTRGPAK